VRNTKNAKGDTDMTDIIFWDRYKGILQYMLSTFSMLRVKCMQFVYVQCARCVACAMCIKREIYAMCVTCVMRAVCDVQCALRA
jgi:hypothetical protein